MHRVSQCVTNGASQQLLCSCWEIWSAECIGITQKTSGSDFSLQSYFNCKAVHAV